MTRPVSIPPPVTLLAPLALLVLPRSAAPQAPGEVAEHVIPGTDVTLTVAYAPAGTFPLGSRADEPGRDPDEGPVRQVHVDAFWIGTHEVTHDAFAVFRTRRLDSRATADPDRTLDVDAVARPSPPYEDPAHGLGGGDRPATGMTQWAALQYARWLSLKTGRLWRLPTEAEWEYACRAGGSDPGGGSATELAATAWYIANTGERLHSVAELRPNAWGLHDMLGNAAEWTLDEYRPDFYATLEPGTANPWARPTDTHPRTVRGGAFDDAPDALRCSAREESTLDWKRRDPQIPKSRWWNTDSPHVGFRLVTPQGEWTVREIEEYWADLLGPGGP